ncbi:hypothetical protein [Acinetobacter baumannii]|uniref:hypothetical protein n=1 Tax=Acinetobacter baumannii TaxID=470 RepID=UPI00280FF8F6|nr:hypothetical protein [Acinetobacter baumannii]MDQ8938176.1 hypothetical protein [Acinetobacter baumannii]MDQ9851955.1 hypothetical protein [Acinetobacter baumannii]
MDKCREEFEIFAADCFLPLEKKDNIIYLTSQTHAAWVSWRHQQAKIDQIKTKVNSDIDKLTFTIITMLKQIRTNPEVIRDMSDRQFNQHIAELEQALKGEGQ